MWAAGEDSIVPSRGEHRRALAGAQERCLCAVGQTEAARVFAVRGGKGHHCGWLKLDGAMTAAMHEPAQRAPLACVEVEDLLVVPADALGPLLVPQGDSGGAVGGLFEADEQLLVGSGAGQLGKQDAGFHVRFWGGGRNSD